MCEVEYDICPGDGSATVLMKANDSPVSLNRNISNLVNADHFPPI